MRLVLGLALLTSLALGLGATLASGEEQLDRGTVTLDAGGRRVAVSVEIARTESQRARGLMGRRSLAPRAGMVFLYPEGSRSAFWMKGTRIALSAAFYDRRGRILRILRMEPCRADPCPLYDPRVSYWGVLEVAAGSFRRWGMRPGATIAVAQAQDIGS